MMITRETDYAIRILRALKSGKQQTIEQICLIELVPRQFAYKILKKLERGGMVSIRRGAGGGCSLGRALEELTLLDVIHATDQEFFLTPCLGSEYRCEYTNRLTVGEESFDTNGSKTPGSHKCSIHCELNRVQLVLEQELRRKTLAQLFNLEAGS